MLVFVTLLTSFAVQIGYTAYCIKEKAQKPMIKNIARIAAFAIFALLLIIGVYEWGFRWFLLFAVLTVLAIIGGVYFIRKSKKEMPFKTSRAVVSCVLGLLLFTVSTLPGIVFPQYKPIKPTGKYDVSTVTYTYTDPNRPETFTSSGENRNVTAEFWYPQNAEGIYPLVLFTHGLYGIAISNSSTFEELASNGYVVCSVSHPFLSYFTRNANGDIILADSGYMTEAAVLNSGTDDEELIYETFNKLLEIRTADMNFVIDTILANAGTDDVYRLIDTDRIGLFGHSMGGTTVTIIGSERGDIDAVVNLDAPLVGELFRNDIYPLPLLNIYSDDLWGHMDEDPLYSANVRYLSDTPADIYNDYFGGAKHMNFTDLPLFSPIISNALQGGKSSIDRYYCIETMNRVILDFFNCYLKNDGTLVSSGTY